jgi:hypothetical protein
MRNRAKAWSAAKPFSVENKRLFFQQDYAALQPVEALGKRIFGKISQRGRGWVFSPDDFQDLGDPRFIGMALSRLVSTGTIRRLARGLYDYPESDPALGALAPSPDAIAKALAGRHNIRLLPSGSYALKLLGLTQDLAAPVVFLTDGRSRTVHVGDQEIRLKQTTPRNMGPAGRTSGLVIQALRHLGQQQVNPDVIVKLSKRLSAEEKKQLLEDLPYAPAWVRTHLREIAKGDS